jgi:hypothetical protein
LGPTAQPVMKHKKAEQMRNEEFFFKEQEPSLTIAIRLQPRPLY